MIGRALESVKWADALYVCDTGSQDKTVEIVRKYTDNVCLSFVWVDDFQKAQNHCKSHVPNTGEWWILSLDSDEVLASTEEEVRAAVELAQDTVRVSMHAEAGGKVDFGFPRLFRNSPDIYWCQAIHKHLNVPGEGEPVGNVRIVYGHSPAHNLDPDRSLRMLERTVALEEHPVRNLYYLGREYWYKERYQDAIDTLLRYVKVAHWHGEAADAWLVIGQCYCALQKAEECGDAILQAIKINANFKEAIEFMASIVIPPNRLQWQRMARGANNEGLVWKRTQVERMDDIVAICPHNDDEALYLGFTLIRERPLVIIVTDSHIQPERGDIGCTAEIRRQETIEAMKIAGCPVVFLGIKDTELTKQNLIERLKHLNPTKVYAPAIQGGNGQHDLVGRVCEELFGDRVKQYTTYTKTELYTVGNIEVKPTPEEMKIKDKMLACYQSQIALASTWPHFEAVENKSEWLL